MPAAMPMVTEFCLSAYEKFDTFLNDLAVRDPSPAGTGTWCSPPRTRPP